MDLATPLTSALGGRTAKALESNFSMTTVGHLLSHYPRRYVERGALTAMTSLRPDEHVTVMGEILSARETPFKARRGSRLEVVITDGGNELSLTFFNQSWRKRELLVGRRGLFAGKVGVYNRKMQLTNPDYQLSPEDKYDVHEMFSSGLIPVYPSSGRLTSWKIAECMGLVLSGLTTLPEHLTERIRLQARVLGLLDAYRGIHQPSDMGDVEAARKRLRFDEAYTLQIRLAQMRWAAAAVPATPREPLEGGLRTTFDSRLPFELTAGQRSVGAEIDEELARSHPMHRLLQGEVGSGKTIVALRAMLAVVDRGGQAALLAPTEVLAMQHARSIRAMLGELSESGVMAGDGPTTGVALLTGSQGSAARRTSLMDVFTGDAGIVVGTHALLEDKVVFNDLGLVVVDEQHRFGVEQRAALAAKSRDGSRPHVLVMTATPIPRTVAMTVFGDLEVSTLRELPVGRQGIASHVVPAEKPRFEERSWTRIREEVAAGRQAYIVCPRIGDDVAEQADEVDEPSDTTPAAGVLERAAYLSDGPLSGLRIDVLHGRMSADDKERVMAAFGAGEIDVLVATTVIEVGVDVPNATVMAILDADRFGISQLHQLRGRVGRGSHPGLCLLFTSAPPGSPARERLDVVAETSDGFELSRFDLKMRREGDILGASQSGRFTRLRLLSALRDEELIAQARRIATEVVARDPDLERSPELAAAVQGLLDENVSYLEKS